MVYLDRLALEFVEIGQAGEYPWLASVGTLVLNARAGHLTNGAVTEAPSVAVQLDNRGNQVARLLGRPLRARAEIYDDSLFFPGIVATVAYGRTMILGIEA